MQSGALNGIGSNLQSFSESLSNAIARELATSDSTLVNQNLSGRNAGASPQPAFQQSEPNDILAQAVNSGLSSSNPGTFSFSSAIGNNPNVPRRSDVDLISFQLNAGDTITLDIDANVLGSRLNSFVRLFDANGTQLAFNDDAAAPGESATVDSYLNFTANTSGTYFVGISSSGNSSYNPLVAGSGTGLTTGQYTAELTLSSTPPPPPVSNFNIDVVFTDNSLTSSQQAIFTAAANRWAEIIVGDVPDVFVQGLGLVDDIVIEASAPLIDGVGNILGQAGPTALRTGSFLPAAGIMEFDAADLAQLEAAGQLDEVILHEMGHVLGIGTIWRNLGLVTTGFNLEYLGAGAIAEYNAIFGLNASSVPVENTGGPGTRGGHWRESVFGNELLTGFLNAGVSNPLSRITAASLGDLGYQVNVNAADPYSPPGTSSSLQAVRQPLGEFLTPLSNPILV